jgi:predicted DNA-binding transcriptional regulator YafY
LDTYIRTNEELAYPVSGKSIKLEALFDARTAVHLSERPLSKDQRMTPQKDGRVLLQATVRDTLELRWWLLGFGDKVEVVGPKALREEFKDIVERMTDLYK